MDNKRNSLQVDYQSSPELRALFNSWSVGEKYRLEIEVQLDSMDENGAMCSIQEIVDRSEGSGKNDSGDEETEIEPDATKSPVMMVMSAGKNGEKEPVTTY